MGLVAGKAGGAAEHRKRQGLSQPRQKESMGSRSLPKSRDGCGAVDSRRRAVCLMRNGAMGTIVIERSIAGD